MKFFQITNSYGSMSIKRTFTMQKESFSLEWKCILMIFLGASFFAQQQLSRQFFFLFLQNPQKLTQNFKYDFHYLSSSLKSFSFAFL